MESTETKPVVVEAGTGCAAEEDRRVGETSSRRHRNIRGGTKEDPTATVPAGRARTKMAEVRRVVKRKSREKKRD